MNRDKVDALMPIVAVLLAAMLVGMVLDVWQLAWFPIPLLATVFIAFGCMNREDRWGPTKPWLLGFGVVALALFVWAGAGMMSQSPTFGGLSLAMGVTLYVIWPATIAATFLYAYLYSRWLSRDVREDTSLGESADGTREHGDV